MAKLSDLCFTYNPSKFPNYKKVALILQKFGIGHVPMRILDDSYSNEETFHFTEKLDGKYSRDEMITVRMTSDESIGVCVANIGSEVSGKRRRPTKKKKLSLEYTGFDVNVGRELKERFEPFLDHANAAFRGFKIKGTGGCNIDKDTDEFKNSNACLANVKFFEDSSKLWLPLLKGIASYSILNDSADININQFGKLKGKEYILETLHPQSDKTINHVLDGFAFMKEHNVSNFITGPISCTYYARNQWNAVPKIDVKFGGMHIMRECSLERFRYMFNPGLHLIAHFMKQDGTLDAFKYSIQKQVFRSI